jgi:hypothetical protein
MGFFDTIFDVFSKREDLQESSLPAIPQTFRRRLLLYCTRDLFRAGGREYEGEFWQQIHEQLLYRKGQFRLHGASQSLMEDVSIFLMSCDTPDLFDFIESIFKVDSYFHIGLSEQQVVTDINDLFRTDDLPYYLTEVVKETVQEPVTLYGHTSIRTVIKTIAYPSVILKESDLLHAEAVAPTLDLLRRPHFKTANTEFREALQDYRKGDYGDCLTKCNSALESTLKIICDRKGWPYQQTDAAVALLKVFISHTSLDPYFETMLSVVPILRNKMSSAHGSGVTPRQPTQHLAQFAIHATATTILFLAAEAGER